MCGIAGIWRRDGEPVEAAALRRMGAILAHRGPDGFGTHLDGEVGLANRRLRIIDLSPEADQPMGLPDGSLWLTFNGEIHNYVELRRELAARGVRFRTRGDTEVVLWAYATWGRDCFERFNGMWALALWDARNRQLTLSRDRFGIKPLCYSVRGDRVCFASEAKAILAGFPEERRANEGEIAGYLGGARPDIGPDTFFKNVSTVRPGTLIVFDRAGARTHDYWTFVPGEEAARRDAPAEFRDLLADAIKLRTRSDVPVGACLSGGLDSGAIVSLMNPKPVVCFSTRYDEVELDESRYAELIAAKHGLAVSWVRPKPVDLIETMGKIVWHHDAPSPARGRIAQWFVMQEASRHVKVVLEGHGGDELLAGYERNVIPYLIDRISQGGGSPLTLWRDARHLNVENPLHWFALTAAAGYLRDPRRHGERPYASALNNVLWDELRRNGLPEALHGADALGMAFSLESRMPFLDHRLVEFCFSLPFTDKISGGFTKSLLRRSMRDTVPEEILARRRKFGFLAPVTHWLRLEPNWLQARDLLLDPASLARGTSERRRLEVELNAFRHGPYRYARMRMPRVWRRISLELFFREFIDGAGLAPPHDGLPHVAAFGAPPATAPSLR